MTYNVQGMKPGTNHETRLYHIIQNLQELDPDIICLQEINALSNGQNNQAETIVDSLSAHFGIPYYLYQQYTHMSWNNQYPEYIAIISKHPVQQQGYHQLATGVFPRKVVWNYIDGPPGLIHLFNTHLSYNSQSVRYTQVQQIMGYIETQEAVHEAVATILTGDFNDQPNTSPIQLLTNTGTDTFYVISYFEANPGSPGYTVPANAPDAKIDYVFYKNTGMLTVASSEIVMNVAYNGQDYCSDHLGITTTFTEGNAIEDSRVDQIPDELLLYPNHPNPVSWDSPMTTIRYDLPESANVKLALFNIAGQLVSRLVARHHAAGVYEIQWNGTSDSGERVASGVYFYRLQAGDEVQTRKMVLVR